MYDYDGKIIDLNVSSKYDTTRLLLRSLLLTENLKCQVPIPRQPLIRPEVFRERSLPSQPRPAAKLWRKTRL